VVALDAVAGVLLGSMPRRWEHLVQHDRVRRCSVGDHLHRGHLRRGDGPFEEPAGRGDVTPRGDEHVNNLAELIDRPVHIPPSPSDLHIGLVHEPAISYSVPAGAGGLGQQRREPLHPSVDGDVVDLDPSFSQSLLNVAVRQPEAQVPADSNDDYVGWEAEASEGGSCSWSGARAAGSHAGSLALRLRSQPTQQCHGGTIASQCLNAGLLDEIWVDLVPVLLGGGTPFFDQLKVAPVELEGPTSVVQGTDVTHLRYRVRSR
jgi:hypothetical protein